MTESESVQSLLGLEKPPVAIGFFDAPPPDVPPWQDGPVPAGCAFWREAQAGGAGHALTTVLGRPGCAILPLTGNTHAAALSLGCQGNRTFTGLPDAQMYVSLPGEKWPAVAAKVAAILAANRTMAAYYTAK